MKKAIVVGAGSGLGRGIAALLVSDGYQVAITGRRTALPEEIARQNPEQHIISGFDVTIPDAMTQKLDELAEKPFPDTYCNGNGYTTMICGHPECQGGGRFRQASVSKASEQIFMAIKAKKKVVYITK